MQATRKNTRIRVTVLFKNPRVQPTPTASGTLRVLTARSKVVCNAKVKKSRATCTVPSKHKGRKLQAVVTGMYSSGFPVWHSAKVRAAK